MNLLCILFILAFPAILHAESKTVLVEASYSMGEGETPTQAEAKAFDAAKEKAVTQLTPLVMDQIRSHQLSISPQQVRAITEATAEIELMEKRRQLAGERLQFMAKVRGALDGTKVLSEIKRREKRMQAEKLTKEADDIERQIMSKRLKQLESKTPLPREDFSSDYRKAFQLYSQAIDTDPTFAAPYVGRYSIYNHQYSQLDKALADLSRAIELAPDEQKRSDYHAVRANTYKGLGEKRLAIADFTEAINRNPKVDYLVDYLYERGQLFDALGQKRQAIDDFSRLLNMELSKDKEWRRKFTLDARASAYVGLKQYDQALADYGTLIRLTNGAEGYEGRALLYMELHELEKAVLDFTQEIAQQKNRSPSELHSESESLKRALFMRAFAYNMLGQDERVVTDVTEYLQHEPTNQREKAAAYDLRGRAYGSLNLKDKALADYTEAIRADSERASSYYRRGMIYTFMRVWDRGISDLTEALRLHHMDSVASDVKLKDDELAGAYLLRGGAHLNLKHLDQSLSDLNETLTRSPKEKQALFWRGLTHAQLKDTASARTDLRQACQLGHDMACKALQPAP